MNLTPQQQFEKKNSQFRIQLDELQEAQQSAKKKEQFIEQLQERFYSLQQQEQRVYHESLHVLEPHERAFFEARAEDSFHLSRKALQEFEEKQEQVRKERKALIEKEEAVRLMQRSFLKSVGKETVHGS